MMSNAILMALVPVFFVLCWDTPPENFISSTIFTSTLSTHS